jgi:hypothetical protein
MHFLLIILGNNISKALKNLPHKSDWGSFKQRPVCDPKKRPQNQGKLATLTVGEKPL